MKKFNILAVATLFITLAFTSCSETPVTDDEQVILETQAIDKEDASNPNNDGGEAIGRRCEPSERFEQAAPVERMASVGGAVLQAQGRPPDCAQRDPLPPWPLVGGWLAHMGRKEEGALPFYQADERCGCVRVTDDHRTRVQLLVVRFGGDP